MIWQCHKCGKTWEAEGQPGFRAVCPHCEAYLHCCLNCRLYDEYAHNKCKSPTTDWVGDREKLNRCEEFQMRKPRSEGMKGEAARGGQAQWEFLWKKKKP